MAIPPGVMPPMNINSSSSAKSGSSMGGFSFGGVNVGTNSKGFKELIPVIIISAVALGGLIILKQR